MNLDRNKIFWNENETHLPNECDGITVADLGGNYFGFSCDPDYSYAAAFGVDGSTPSINGENPLMGMRGAVAYGLLPASEETFDSDSKGVGFTSKLSNFPPDQIAKAQKYTMKGVQQLYSFDEICAWMHKTQIGVQINVKWYQSFNSQTAQGGDGMLPLPSGPYIAHSSPIYSDDNGMLMMKPLRGPNFGHGGYVFITPEMFKLIFISANGFDPNALRWLSLLSYTAERYPLLNAFLPQIIAKMMSK